MELLIKIDLSCRNGSHELQIEAMNKVKLKVEVI